MKDALKYAFILGLICFLSSALLAAVNEITQEKIIQEKERELNSALKEIIPRGVDFKPHIQEEEVIYYSAYDKTKKLIGFAFKSEAKGYSSNIEILTGVNLNLEIESIKMLAQNETPGLGNRILEPAFQEQFKGKNLDTFSRIQAITGATISSSAAIDSIKNKISELGEELIKEIHYGR